MVVFASTTILPADTPKPNIQSIDDELLSLQSQFLTLQSEIMSNQDKFLTLDLQTPCGRDEARVLQTHQAHQQRQLNQLHSRSQTLKKMRDVEMRFKISSEEMKITKAEIVTPHPARYVSPTLEVDFGESPVPLEPRSRGKVMKELEATLQKRITRPAAQIESTQSRIVISFGAMTNTPPDSSPELASTTPATSNDDDSTASPTSYSPYDQSQIPTPPPLPTAITTIQSRSIILRNELSRSRGTTPSVSSSSSSTLSSGGNSKNAEPGKEFRAALLSEIKAFNFNGLRSVSEFKFCRNSTPNALIAAFSRRCAMLSQIRGHMQQRSDAPSVLVIIHTRKKIL